MILAWLHDLERRFVKRNLSLTRVAVESVEGNEREREKGEK